MNRGDFGHTYMPKTFRIVALGKYQAVNGVTSAGGAGFALGTFSAPAPAALTITFPQDVIDQLKADGLVTPTAIALYDTALDPMSSSANLQRYLSLLQRLAPADVHDGL